LDSRRPGRQRRAVGRFDFAASEHAS
jgi:hypothetical protein